MALLFMDSFDHLVTADLTRGKWNSRAGTVAVTAGQGRHGSSSVRLSSNDSNLIKSCGTANTTVIVGVAVRSPVTHTGAATFLTIRDASGSFDHLLFACAVGGAITVHRGSNPGLVGSLTGATLLGTASAGLAANTYAYVELKVVLAAGTGGSVSVRLNGGAPVLTLTGISTLNSFGTAGWSGIALASAHSVSQFDFDDLYVLDGTGTAPRNDWLGDCRVDAVGATAAGANTGWTPSAGANWQCVDDAAPNDDTDYTSASAAPLTATFVVGDVPVAGAIIYGVQQCLMAKKVDAGAASLAPVIRHAGVDYPGANVNPGLTYAYLLQIAATNPGTSAEWTAATFNAAEFGYRKTL